MSSKKARRKERRQQEQEQGSRKGKFSPVTLFMLAIGAAVLLTIGGAALFTDRSGRGAPPFPGAVWSESHGHWH